MFFWTIKPVSGGMFWKTERVERNQSVSVSCDSESLAWFRPVIVCCHYQRISCRCVWYASSLSMICFLLSFFISSCVMSCVFLYLLNRSRHFFGRFGTACVILSFYPISILYNHFKEAGSWIHDIEVASRVWCFGDRSSTFRSSMDCRTTDPLWWVGVGNSEAGWREPFLAHYDTQRHVRKKSRPQSDAWSMLFMVSTMMKCAYGMTLF